MRMVFSLVLVLGLALAGFAVYMARGILSQNAAALQDAQAKTKETVPVFIMNKAVKYGDVLKKDDVATISWPKAAIPETAFTDFNKLFPADGQLRIATRDIGKFEPVLTSNVTEPGGDAGITTRLTPGMRAFAVKVDVASGVSGFLKPGDRVGVYWTGTSIQDHSDVTRLIEQGVDVVAVDQISNADQSAKAIIARTITVQATPQQVAVLAQAQATGKLALSLVGAQDKSVATAVEVDSNRLLGIQAQAPVAAPEKPKVCTIKQRSGSDVVEVPIPCTD